MDRDIQIQALLHGDESEWAAEQARIDAWMDAGCPDVDDWLAGRTSAERPKHKAADELPPSELAHMHALTKVQAGKMLGGKSEDWIEKHVLPNVKTVLVSRSVLIPAAELKRWVAANTGSALNG